MSHVRIGGVADSHYSTGTRVLQSRNWDPDNADLVAYCDASLDGLGFWYPGLSAGFWSVIPENPPKDTILDRKSNV